MLSVLFPDAKCLLVEKRYLGLTEINVFEGTPKTAKWQDASRAKSNGSPDGKMTRPGNSTRSSVTGGSGGKSGGEFTRPGGNNGVR